MFSTAKALVASQVSMVPFAIAALIYWVFNFVVEMLLGAARSWTIIMTNSVMKIENARKAFGGNEVLKDISLEVKRGEVIGDYRAFRWRQVHAAAVCHAARDTRRRLALVW